MAEAPETETVYKYKKLNTATKIWEYPTKKSTKSRISRLRGKIIADSAEEVPAEHVDEKGQYNPPEESDE